MKRAGLPWTVIVGLAIAVSATGCGESRGTSGAPAAGGASTPGSAAAAGGSAVPAGGSAGPASGSSAAPGSNATAPAPSARASIDPGLLAILPATVDGRPVAETPEAEHASASDPSIARSVRALAMGYVASPSGADWAIASIVALRAGAWSDAFFRDWRDTYDAGACESQGGIGGHASGAIGGREVDIATCGPLRIYHVHLAGRDVVISVASVGEGRYGELVIAGLRP